MSASVGYELEGILRELFAHYDLDPKASFRPSAEQIDGAFSFEGMDYLLEARWRQALADSADLDVLEGKKQTHPRPNPRVGREGTRGARSLMASRFCDRIQSSP